MRRRMVIGVLAGVLALAAAGCGGGDDEGEGSASATTAAPETTSAPGTTAAAGGGGEDELQLAASGTAWDTTSFELTSGTNYSIEVDNQDGVQHNFTFEEAQADVDIPANEDATVTFTAPAAGSYEFVCAIHPAAMKGTITVT
ncbi:MAG TPA: cupredoxin domain-containing protein [Actinomycetota bacterium]|jgi:plastocyanin|nr:cupredoxin domain-containing protein [Actinomycetota bacterium]